MREAFASNFSLDLCLEFYNGHSSLFIGLFDLDQRLR